MVRGLSFLNAKSKTVVSAAVLLGVMTMASRLLGVIRDRLLSGAFGAGPELDAYYAAFRAPDFVYSILVYGAITGGFIPVLTHYLTRDGGSMSADHRAWDFTSRVLCAIGVILVAVAAAGAVLARPLVTAFTPGFSPEQLTMTIALTRLMFLSPVLLGLSGILGGLLQTFKSFLVFAAAPLLYNAGIIFGTVALAPSFGIYGVALGVVIGSFLHFLLQLVGCLSMGYRFRFLFDLRDKGLRTIARLMVPRTASMAVMNLNLVMLTAVASTVGAGSISVINLANNLQSFPVNILGVSFAIAAFPFITELAAQDRKKELAESFSKTARAVLFMIIPATVVFLLLRAQIVRVILGTGRFDWADTIETADTLAYFTLSLFAQALLPLIVRVFLAFHDAVTPLVIGLLAVVTERLLAWYFVSFGLGTPGLALAFSVGSVLNLGLLWALLRLRVGSLEEARIFRAAAVMSACALPMALAMQVVKVVVGDWVNMRTFVGIFTQGTLAGALGLTVYFGLALLTGSEEARYIVRLLKRRVAPIPAEVDVKQRAGTIEAE